MAIPKTMQAAVVEKFGAPLVVRELPVPTPGPGQALVEIIASGVCHTDLHAADGDWPVKPTLPFTPGHEGAGIVAALGPGVTHLKEGDRVGIVWLHSACGHCEFCLSGWETLCLEQKNSGYSVNGSFAQYAVAQADYLGRIPKNLSFVDAAPILCAGVTTYKGLKETNTRPGEWVVISGVGGLGHVAIQYAKAMGLHVAAVDLGPEKMALAKKLGKIGVLSGVCDGFIGNRMLAVYRAAADHLMEDGASPYQIDKAVREFGFSMGPYQVIDLAGGDIGWATRKRRAATRNPDARYVQIPDRLCERGQADARRGIPRHIRTRPSSSNRRHRRS